MSKKRWEERPTFFAALLSIFVVSVQAQTVAQFVPLRATNWGRLAALDRNKNAAHWMYSEPRIAYVYGYFRNL